MYICGLLVYLLLDFPGENGLAEPIAEKPSLRRVLNKCRESNLLPQDLEKNNSIRMHGESNQSDPVNLQACSQPGAILSVKYLINVNAFIP